MIDCTFYCIDRLLEGYTLSHLFIYNFCAGLKTLLQSMIWKLLVRHQEQVLEMSSLFSKRRFYYSGYHEIEEGSG